MDITEKHGWWSQLRHSGLLISPVMLAEVFPDGLITPNDFARQFLRENYNRFAALNSDSSKQTNSLEPVLNLLDYIVENFLKMDGKWLKSNQIDKTFVVSTIFNENIKPNRVFYTKHSLENPFLVVFVENHKRLGVGKSRQTYGQILRYLRTKNIKLAIQFNGAQIRLIYAGIDNESWVEWEVADWFESSEHLQKLSGFYTLLGKKGLESRDNFTIPLIAAIDGSRNKQSELSSVLGEQIRQAIELLVDDFNKSREKNPDVLLKIKTNPDGSEISDDETLNAILQASVRIIMRIVVILFAEARDLLPRSSEKYHSNYGVEGMFEILRKARSKESDEFLDELQSEWLKLLGLFRVIYFGSPHPDLQIPKYGGQLFSPGNEKSDDSVSRALAVYESDSVEVTNATLFAVLDKLKYGKLKIKQGRSSVFIKGPVDFSELRTEYIGIIYEGILDYILRSASETMVLLNIGLQPILPLSVLETLNKKDLKDLFDKFSKTESSDDSGEEDDSLEEEIVDLENPEEEQENEEELAEVTDDSRIRDWAVKTVLDIGLVKNNKKKTDDFLFNKAVVKSAKTLIKKVYYKDEFYLTLWGGTRKGTGTFYTKPQLAIPTVRRTLEPLVYEYDDNGNLIPKLPEVILSVKVCDPGCGSASFLVAATHYLTDVLYESLVFNTNLLNQDDYKRKTLPFGLKVETPLEAELLPCSPGDDKFEDLVKARLRRSVVEFCIYGVDINPMAVELARLSLWIETMDKNLPFEFLDHKIKTGNSLAGAWLDNFREYPLAAWLREGGDKSHPSSVNEKPGLRTKDIRRVFNDKVKKELIELILRRQGEQRLSFIPEPEEALTTHNALFLAYEDLHEQAGSMFGAEQREKIYIDKILNSSEYRNLKDSMDIWCSIWFWDTDKIDLAPTPFNLYSPPEETLSIARAIASKYRFFHWEIEFPDVFNKHRQGFDAIIGNPPWEASKPDSKEYFSRMDPVYRSYVKQVAIVHQKEYFTANPQIESDWLSYLGSFKALSNFFSKVYSPFGDPQYSEDDSISLGTGKQYSGLHNLWREQRNKNKGFSNPQHPYYYQGSADLNLYKLFLEQSHYLIKKFGRLGMIVPSGIYSDNGTKSLRKLFINFSEWEWLFVFENKLKIFDIHRSSKFNPVIVQKGGITKSIKTAFMRTNLAEWENATDVMEYPEDLIKKLSPNNLSILELQNNKDIEIITKIYNKSNLLGLKKETGWNLTFGTEYHSDSDSKSFTHIDVLNSNLFRKDVYGIWRKEEFTGLPLYEGRMIGQFDFSSKGYVSGSNRSAIWRDIPFEQKVIEPQNCIMVKNYEIDPNKYKIVFMRIGSATNTRSMYSTILDDMPCTDSVPKFFNQEYTINDLIPISIIFNSFTFDFALRKRLGGVQINYFIMEESPLPQLKIFPTELNLTGFRLCLIHNKFSYSWLEILRSHPEIRNVNLKSLWALTPHERLRLRCILDAAVAELYGISYEDFEWILKDDPSDPKGFWRIDKNKPKELRHTTLALEAFKHLKEIGLDKFIEEDWQFRPEIQEQLGPRFYNWQLEGTPEESWAECEFHAKQLLGEENYKKFISNLENPKTSPSITEEHPSKDDDSKDEWKLF